MTEMRRPFCGAIGLSRARTFLKIADAFMSAVSRDRRGISGGGGPFAFRCANNRNIVMAFAEGLLEIDPVTGIAVGIGTIVLWPLVSRVGRPITKELIKGGMRLYKASASAAAAVNELVAETQVELLSSKSGETPGGRTKARS